jgi:hypothetical protein
LTVKLRPEALAQRARELAISEGITIREAYKELGRRAGKASVAKRKQKQLSIQPTLPVLARLQEALRSPSRIEIKSSNSR